MSSSVFKRGQTLTRQSGLNIFLKNRDGTVKNAAEISYSLYDFTTGSEVLLPPDGRVPVNPAVGEYFASFSIPIEANIGKYRIRWKIKEYVYSSAASVVQEFEVIPSPDQTSALSGFTANESDMIKSLRTLLRDNNPSRNYHFMPPTGEGSLNSMNRVFGTIWEDAELHEFLRVSLDIVNMHPPRTFWASLDALMSDNAGWRSLILTGGMVYALQALSINWTADEFSYSIGGVSLDIDKSSKYSSMADSIDSRFKEMLSADTGAKATIKITRGLTQSRYGIGIRSSFGPSVGRGALTPRRFLGI
jgi:hypothetical protein